MKHLKTTVTSSLLIATTLIFLTSCGSDVSTSDIGSSDGNSKQTYDAYSNATLYEDAENGSTDKWQIWSGFDVENADIGANGSNRSIYVKRNWDLNDPDNPINNANYVLPMDNDWQFVLEFDKLKERSNLHHCFTTGATIDTEYGVRYISFNTFYDREGYNASTQEVGEGIQMVFPLSMDYVNDSGVWKHIKLNLEEYLHEFEPNNTIYNVRNFYFQGGNDYLDNIRLTSE